MKKLLLYISIFCFVACEEVVDVELETAPEALVIDAWITDKAEPQHIYLTRTQPYFDASIPDGVTNATVSLTSSTGEVLVFQEASAGVYIWEPTVDTQISTVGTVYTLEVTVDGESFFSQTRLNRVPPVDSIRYTFKEERNVFQPEGYYAEFFATDPVGPGDTYWIKAYKNGQLLNNPFDLNIAFDAGFNEGGNIDGLVFIQPIQDAVTPLNEELDEIVPYVIGDSLYVEIHSISNEAFAFLQQVQIQTQRDGGFDEIFAEPLENVSTNIAKGNPDTETQVIGFFNVAAVAGAGKRLTE